MSNTERIVMIPLAPHTHTERERGGWERGKEGETGGSGVTRRQHKETENAKMA